ncbi:uncharacterized protein LOC128202675 isoform X2 [Mya arenaria]|uniref:uncharacterized protein LOC128202675 isoform X2 n=1 Tax=Mya arenaria TaxID=6604 RepID=UPI0022E495A5|nr:uncharacterized protein LOC128202675 isoform X2 [Mya arenaria]
MFSPSMEQHNTYDLRHIGAQELMRIARTSHGEIVRLKAHRSPIQDILHTRQWHHVFLVLANNSVYIFNDEDSKDAANVFPVKEFKSVEDYKETEPRIVQVLFTEPNRESLMFKCVSTKSREIWYSKLKQSVDDPKFRDSGYITSQYSSTASWPSTSEAGSTGSGYADVGTRDDLGVARTVRRQSSPLLNITEYSRSGYAAVVTHGTLRGRKTERRQSSPSVLDITGAYCTDVTVNKEIFPRHHVNWS